MIQQVKNNATGFSMLRSYKTELKPSQKIGQSYLLLWPPDAKSYWERLRAGGERDNRG